MIWCHGAILIDACVVHTSLYIGNFSHIVSSPTTQDCFYIQFAPAMCLIFFAYLCEITDFCGKKHCKSTKISTKSVFLWSHRASLSIWSKLVFPFCHVVEASAAFQHINIHRYSFNLSKLGYWQRLMILLPCSLSSLCFSFLFNSIPVCLPLYGGGKKDWREDKCKKKWDLEKRGRERTETKRGWGMSCIREGGRAWRKKRDWVKETAVTSRPL